MLDLHRLRLLREVHARGTVSAAAAALGYSTSSVSQQLSVLEREAGAMLLEKVGRNVRVTQAGLVLVQHADSLLAGVEAAEAELAEVASGRVSGLVRVAAFQSALLRVVAPAVRALAASHPGLRVEVTESEVEDSVPRLRLQQLDVVVGDEYAEQPRPVHDGLHREVLIDEPINLVLPADHPAAGADTVQLAGLASMPWAACQPGTGHHQMQLRVCRQLGGFEPDIRYTSDDFLILMELARTTGSATLLPDLVHAQDAPGVVVRSLAEGDIGRQVYLLTRASSPPTVRVVADALHAAATEERSRGS
ncbi:MAG: LysR family transcriptional regulator [Nocardioidaceae bacterium]